MTIIGNLYTFYYNLRHFMKGLLLKGLGNSYTFYCWSVAINFCYYKSWLHSFLYCFDRSWRQLQYFIIAAVDEWLQSTVHRFKLCFYNFLISNIWSEENSIILTSSSEHTVHIYIIIYDLIVSADTFLSKAKSIQLNRPI